MLTLSPTKSHVVALPLGPLAFVELQPVVSLVNFVELVGKWGQCQNAMWHVESLHRGMLKQLNSTQLNSTQLKFTMVIS